MIAMIIQDEKGKCWKFRITRSMRIDETLMGVKAQFYEGMSEVKERRGK